MCQKIYHKGINPGFSVTNCLFVIFFRFQFVATTSGLLRSFPATEWVGHNETAALSNNGLGTLVENVDGSGDYALYDPRLTPIFASTVSGPKNVILLLDTSKTSGNKNNLPIKVLQKPD